MTSTRRDRMRPFEFIALSLVVGIFTGLVVLMSTRDLVVSATWLGISFVVMLVLSATVILMVKPNQSEQDDIAGGDD